MNVVIIEDEKNLAEELQHYILSARKEWTVVKILPSVKQALAWFETNTCQLVFSDIQLGDGLSFEIFHHLKLNVPVIFCTAFNEYAIQAFKNNGIDYILKPYGQTLINDAIAHYESLRQSISPDYHTIIQLLQKPTATSRLLVSLRDKIIPIKTEDIALFYIHHGQVSLIDFEQHIYMISQPLDELEATVGPGFYRADRQHLVNRKAIRDVSQSLGRKLLLNLLVEYNEAVMIRKEKATEFLEWLIKD
ncbi:LytTR family DNA-binding domain-containing protein [Chitinophaga sp. LS1]|uniref:LytR/AlgR family response regulator transcription factor n=1 Tax=Chitinophaga sp. LS1 TaxID=3051176 RepID=UPI002AAC0E81|nr:LytTR family DNA-binding domain-containing protein [Chitinophaga sp. LS1]WPV70411.1 LytTR family DNA-binding domain-containing protein [Chitinophaga sp. LS1]